jgi:hypothetical protein
MPPIRRSKTRRRLGYDKEGIMAYPHLGSMASAAFQDMEENRISPEEYARRTRREVEKLVEESPPPRRRETTREDEPEPEPA